MRKILYLSGAPKVSTSSHSSLSGPRTHILGVIEGMEDNEFIVEKYIYGDFLLKITNLIRLSNGGEGKVSVIKLIINDAFRICSNFLNIFYLRLFFKDNFSYVYERFGAFQFLGILFKGKKTKWILETNSVFYIESNSDIRSVFSSRLCKVFESYAYKKCDYLVCISPDLKNLIVQNFDLNADKIIVVPNGVSKHKLKLPAKVERPFSGFTIGFVGNLAPWCGVDSLINAVYKLKENGKIINVVVVGDGVERVNLQLLCDSLELNSQVKFTGYLKNEYVNEYIEGFDFCYSGQKKLSIGKMYLSPLKIYEYLALGKPVLASSFYESRTLISASNGYVFEENNLTDLVEKLALAERNYIEFKIRKREIQAGIKENHTWASRVEFLMNIIKHENT